MERVVEWVRNAHGTALTRRLIQGAVWVCVAVLAAVHLPIPLTGDQALYMYGAKSLAEGQALYLDFWDVKQPGVYLFYLLAGKLFSFNEIGLHGLEALWFGLAAWFGYRIGRQSGSESALTLLIPLLTAGTYFVAVWPWHMAQPDGLLMTPLAGVAWGLCDRNLLTEQRSRLLIAGFFAGIAAVFKVSVVIVPLAMFLAWYWMRSRDKKTRAGWSVARECVWLGTGLLVPIAGVAIWFALHGALNELIWTTFQYPFLALSEIAHRLQNLYPSAKWFFDVTVFWLPFAAIGAVWSFVCAVRGDYRGRPGVLMLVWLLAGAGTILLQNHYFWAFHFNQFFVPVGILACIGLRVMFDSLNSRLLSRASAVLLVATVLALLLFGNRAMSKFLPLFDALASGDKLRTAYARTYESQNSQIIESVTAALADLDQSESIYVFGDPRLLLASGRIQAVRHNGWALEIMTAEQWREFSAALREASPTDIYVSDDYKTLLSTKYPALLEWITNHYTLYHTDAMAGDWYKRRPIETGF